MGWFNHQPDIALLGDDDCKGPLHKARYFTWHGATMRVPGLGPSSIPMGFRGHSASKRMKHLLQRPGSPVITWRIIPGLVSG